LKSFIEIVFYYQKYFQNVSKMSW